MSAGYTTATLMILRANGMGVKERLGGLSPTQSSVADDDPPGAHADAPRNERMVIFTGVRAVLRRSSVPRAL